MAFKPGLANVLNLKPTSSLRYTKYFPNNSEYASKVYPEKKRKLKHRDAETQTEEDISIPTRKKNKIVDENDIEEKRDQSQPIASQTEGVDVLQSYTQTEDTHDAVEIAIQTEEVDVQDTSKSVYVETHPTVDRENENKQTSGKHENSRRKKKKKQTTPERKIKICDAMIITQIDDSDQYLLNIWKSMKHFGEPRVVVSVVGVYNERTPTYEMANNLVLKKACNHVARFAGRCGFIYKEDDTNFVQSVVYKSAPFCHLPQLYGYSSVYISDDAKEQGTECEVESGRQHTGGTEQKVHLFDIERYINSKGQVSFEDGKKEPSKIRVPVVSLVVNGDLDTLNHVKKAVYNNMSVVVVKGTGGAADLIASCLESFSMNKLKKELPIMFNRRFTNKYFTKIEKTVKRITERDWMITIFAVRVDANYKLWERITDGIIRAWSLEEKVEDEGNGGEYISKYVADIDGLTREELFTGYRINTADELKGKNDEKENNRLQNAYRIAFLGGNTETIRHLTNNTNFYLSEKNFKEIWKQKTKSNSNTTITRLLESVYPGAIDDHEAVKGLSDKLLEGLCFSKIGMITCCGKKFKKNQNNHLSDMLRIDVFYNSKKTAAAMWCTCPNPMMTALISSMYLTALANIAEEQFEENMQEDYESHAELFLSRAVKLFEKMHDDDESMAIAALEYVSEVWGNVESPLHFAQQFNIEEFISHSKIQIDASRRLFPVNKHGKQITDKSYTESTKASRRLFPVNKQGTKKPIKSDTESTKASNNKSSMNDYASPTTPDTTTSKNTETLNMSDKTTENTKSSSAIEKASDSKSSLGDFASQTTPDTTTSKNTETQNMSDNIAEHTKSDSAPKNASGSKSSMGDFKSQTTPDTTAAKNTEPQSMSNKTTEKAAASQNLSKNNTASNTAPQTQEPIFHSKTYSITFSGWFSFVKDNCRTSKLEIITAPVAKIAYHVVFFITALIMFSYFLIGNLNNGSISLLEGLVFIYMSGDFLEEIWSMFRPEKDCIWSHQRIILHLCNLWNILDVLCSTLYILGFCVHIFDSISIVHTRRIYSIALFIMFLRLLNLLLLFKTFGIMIIMVKEMLVDLLRYLVILTIFIFAAGVAYRANVYPNHQVEFWQIFTIIKIPYWQVYGELYLDTLEASDSSSCTDNATIWKSDSSVERCPTGDWLTPVIAAVYMMLTNWLLLNIVIAMFGARFNAIQQKSKQKWRYNRHSVIIDYEDKIPSPLNFPWRILSLITYSKQRCCRCSRKLENADIDNMMAKQLEFAKIIIEEENHRTSP